MSEGEPVYWDDDGNPVTKAAQTPELGFEVDIQYDNGLRETVFISASEFKMPFSGTIIAARPSARGADH